MPHADNNVAYISTKIIKIVLGITFSPCLIISDYFSINALEGRILARLYRSFCIFYRLSEYAGRAKFALA